MGVSRRPGGILEFNCDNRQLKRAPSLGQFDGLVGGDVMNTGLYLCM